MINPIYCDTCKMEELCSHTKEDCKYPEGRLQGVEAERPSDFKLISRLTRRIEILEAGLMEIKNHKHCLPVSDLELDAMSSGFNECLDRLSIIATAALAKAREVK